MLLSAAALRDGLSVKPAEVQAYFTQPALVESFSLYSVATFGNRSRTCSMVRSRV